MSTQHAYTTAPRRGAARRTLIALLLGIFLAGCDSLLEVDLPGNVESGDLENPALAGTLVDSAVGQFECAYTSYIVSAGLLAHEFINTSSFLAINPWSWRGLELRTIVGSCPGARTAVGLGAYAPLQQARYLAEEGFRLIEGFPDNEVPDKTAKLATLAAYAGYSYVLLGEGFCEMAIDQGPLMTRQQVQAGAEEHFTRAISLAETAGLTDLRLMATVGRARARLNQGDLAGAASDAEQIPEGFRFVAEYSQIDGRRENRIHNLNRLARNVGVDFRDYADLEVNGQPDHRVPVFDSGQLGSDNQSPHWFQDKYPSPDTPITLASWEEAQLIIAEARPDEAVAAINRLRASEGLPAFQPTGDILEAVLEERRRQLFAEGHRFSDMLRHNLPFPEGANHKGQPYGPTTCMPLPEQERNNNPNI